MPIPGHSPPAAAGHIETLRFAIFCSPPSSYSTIPMRGSLGLPRSTLLYHTELFSPIDTSPIIDADGAMKALLASSGVLPNRPMTVRWRDTVEWKG